MTVLKILVRMSRSQRFYGLLISLTEIRACLKLAEQWPATVKCPSCWHMKEMMINEPNPLVHCSRVTIAYPGFCFEYSGTKGISRIHGSYPASSSVSKIKMLSCTWCEMILFICVYALRSRRISKPSFHYLSCISTKAVKVNEMLKNHKEHLTELESILCIFWWALHLSTLKLHYLPTSAFFFHKEKAGSRNQYIYVRVCVRVLFTIILTFELVGPVLHNFNERFSKFRFL